MLFVARAFTDRAHASIIFPAAKLVHPLLSMEIPVAPEAATLDPVAGRREKPRSGSRHEDRSFEPYPALLPPFYPLRVRGQESGTVLDLFVSTSSTSVRLRGRHGSASCRNASMYRRVAPVPRTRLVLDSASIQRKFIRDPILT